MSSSDHLSVRGVPEGIRGMIGYQARKQGKTQAQIIIEAITQYHERNRAQACETKVTQLDRIESMLAQLVEVRHG